MQQIPLKLQKFFGCFLQKRTACFFLILLGASAPDLKPPITGLISMGQGGFDARNNDNAAYFGIPGNGLNDLVLKHNAFDGVVINVAWQALQPSDDGRFDTSVIDGALARIRAYNAAADTRVALRAILRVWAGVNAPAWVQRLDGGPVTVYLSGGGGVLGPYSIGHFWSAAYQAAWRRLQARLASRYDDEPLIAEVSNTSCTSDDDESFALARNFSVAGGFSSIANLRAAGLTDAAYERCLLESAQDYAGWRRTLVNATFGWIFLTDGNDGYLYPPKDVVFPAKLLPEWKRVLGRQLVLANHILNYPPDPQAVPTYRDMKQSGVSLEFQTHSPKGLDWADTVLETVCLGGKALELWNNTNLGGYVDFDTATLVGWGAEIKSSAPSKKAVLFCKKEPKNSY